MQSNNAFNAPDVLNADCIKDDVCPKDVCVHMARVGSSLNQWLYSCSQINQDISPSKQRAYCAVLQLMGASSPVNGYCLGLDVLPLCSTDAVHIRNVQRKTL